MGVPGSSRIDIAIYTSAELRADAQLNASIVNVINVAFSRHADFNGKLRFEDADELPQQIGVDGLCAVARSGDAILGTASFKRWRPVAGGAVDEALREHPEDLKLADAGLSYEVKAVATVDSPESRGRGLAGVMIQALLEQVQRERHPRKDILLWLQLSEEQNGAYWRRRGYEQIGPLEVLPKGTWGSTHDFEFLTMVKRMPSATVV